MAIDLTKFTKGKNFLSTDFNFDDPSDKINVKTDATSNVGIAIANAIAAIPTATDTVAGKVSLAVAGNYPEHANDSEAVTPAYYMAGFPASLSGSGYQKLPSGMLIQWGTGTSTNGTLTQTFPVTFTNWLGGQVSVYGFAVDVVAVIEWQSGTDIQIITFDAATGARVAGVKVSWLTIGY